MAGSSHLLIHPIRDVTVVNFRTSSILDALQVQQIGEALYDLVDTRALTKIVVDFSEVKFLSSSALGVLITLHKKAAAIKGRVVLCGLRPELRRVFEISRLDKLLELRETEEQALATFGISTLG